MSLDQASGFVKRQSTGADAFLGGRIVVSQPRSGFRAGFDSVVLGAAVSRKAQTLLELGAGAGVPSLVALAHNPGLNATLVEFDAAVLPLTTSNLKDNGFAERSRVITADLTQPTNRTAAGLMSDAYMSAIANPPFFDPAMGTDASADRRLARQMPNDLLDTWVRAAATHVAPGGETIFIHVPQSLPSLLASFTPRFGAITILPLAPRAGEAAIRVLVRGIKGSRAPLQLLATRVLHDDAGRGFAPQFEAIFRGSAALDW
jgi:tRNA1(Val) A37 N6-methylase TrmN6